MQYPLRDYKPLKMITGKLIACATIYLNQDQIKSAKSISNLEQRCENFIFVSFQAL